MNKLAIALSAALALGVSATASAQSGKITFTGEVQAVTCQVNFPGHGGLTTDPTIALPIVAASSLSVAGNTAGYVPFTMEVSNGAGACTALANAAVELNPNHAARVNGTRLANTFVSAGPDVAATNVDIQLRDEVGNVIPLSATTPWVSPRVAFDSTSNLATFGFSAEYYASAAATPGKVAAELEYTLDYN